MELTNKKIQYTVINNGINVTLNGTVYLNESLKVIDFNGSITKTTGEITDLKPNQSDLIHEVLVK